jgi:hypothetical protein
MLTKVTIAGIDVTNYIYNWTVTESFDQGISTGTIELSLNVSAILSTITTGNSVLIQRGQVTSTDENVFRGQVTQATKQIDRWQLVIRDALIDAIKKNITKSWDINIDVEGGVASEIFKTIVNNYVGLIADNTSVVSTGTLVTQKLTKFIAKEEDAYSKMKELADIYGYYILYNPTTNKVEFKPKGYTTYGTMTVGAEVINVPKWLQNMEQLRNKITVHGGAVQDKITQTFNGTGAITTFSLSRTPDDTQVFVGGVLKTRGVTGSSSTYDYTVDSILKTLNFVIAPPAGTNNVSITYGAMIPIPVVVKNLTSIATYGGPNLVPHEYTIQLQQVVTLLDAERYGNEMLSRYSTPFNQTSIMLSNDQLALGVPKVGQFIEVIDPFQAKDLVLQINEINKKYPHTNDEFIVGDQRWRTMQFNVTTEDKIRQLLEQLNQNQDLLLSVFDMTRDINYESRYMLMIKTALNSTVLIWGSPVQGFWGINLWYNPATGFIVGSLLQGILGTNILGALNTTDYLWRVIQGSNIYKEFFYDNDFKGTGTATWNTVTKQLTFTSGQTMKTGIIALGTVYSYFTVTLASLTGSILTEISYDAGTTWQTVTLGTRTAFAGDTTSGVVIRFTENAASTATIANTYNQSGSYNNPGIKVILEE